MGFLPRDYVGVDTRIEKAHEKHKEQLSIETEFDIKDKTVIFTARVKIKATEQVFTGHSFGEVGKEKAFEKLETVAVGRALAFAGFETRDGIASREEMEVWEDKKEYPEGASTPTAGTRKASHNCTKCGKMNEDVTVRDGPYGPYFNCVHCGGNSKVK